MKRIFHTINVSLTKTRQFGRISLCQTYVHGMEDPLHEVVANIKPTEQRQGCSEHLQTVLWVAQSGLSRVIQYTYNIYLHDICLWFVKLLHGFIMVIVDWFSYARYPYVSVPWLHLHTFVGAVKEEHLPSRPPRAACADATAPWQDKKRVGESVWDGDGWVVIITSYDITYYRPVPKVFLFADDIPHSSCHMWGINCPLLNSCCELGTCHCLWHEVSESEATAIILAQVWYQFVCKVRRFKINYPGDSSILCAAKRVMIETVPDEQPCGQSITSPKSEIVGGA